jgi:hypothetical protein
MSALAATSGDRQSPVIDPSSRRHVEAGNSGTTPSENVMRATLPAVLALLVCAGPAMADEPFPATLAGHVVIPAETFIDAPADAPADLKTPGKFTTGRRVDAVGSVEGKSFDRPTGVKYPFRGQPIQGHSGIKRVGDGAFWVITDNGFGTKANSPDSMLYLNQYRFDWNNGAAERFATIFLRDPDKKVPFRIANEAREERYLTGADFDIESFQPVGDKIWIGDEFGPYLLRLDRTGKVEAVFETTADGKPARSPDHYAVTSPATPSATAAFNVRRSKGYEASMPCSKGRCGTPTRKTGKRPQTARSICASLNSTPPARNGPADTGNTCSIRTVSPSGIST